MISRAEARWIAACTAFARVHVRRLAPLLLALASAACGPSLSGDPRWVQWFSYRSIFDMAVSPEGQTLLVGRSTSDETTTNAPFGQSTWRPWLARIDADGTRLEDWTGYLGELWAVAVDADGRAYVLAVEPLGASVSCQLRALDLDGQVRWSMPWDPAPYGCPTELVIAGDTVAVRHDDQLEAFDLDGTPRWQQPVEGPDLGRGHLAAFGDSIWVTGTIPGLDPGDLPQTLAWRYDARDGGVTEVSLDLGPERLMGTFAANGHGLIVISSEVGSSSGGRVFMASLTLEGRRRWEHEIAREPVGPDALTRWATSTALPVTDGDDAWIIGSEQRREQLDSPQPSERVRMMMQRWSGGGVHEGTLRHSFEDLGAATLDEADPAVRARSECPSSDAQFPPRFGSLALDAVVRPDGGLLVAGAHGCRDAFLLRLEVER
jgi:hypothetical protein